MNIEQIKPYQNNKSRKEQVREMFNHISGKYDAANTILSIGIHKLWKKKCVSALKKYQPKIILDLATGTADIAIQMVKLNPEKIIAADYADEMLMMASKKIKEKKLEHLITVQKEDGENLSFVNETFDAVTVSFGIRNFENYRQGLSEIYRVLKKGGVLIILEFTLPKNFLLKFIYRIYFKRILPIIAWFITADKKAYDYLPESVQAFPQYEDLCKVIEQQGFSTCQYYALTGGIATLYIAEK